VAQKSKQHNETIRIIYSYFYFCSFHFHSCTLCLIFVSLHLHFPSLQLCAAFSFLRTFHSPICQIFDILPRVQEIFSHGSFSEMKISMHASFHGILHVTDWRDMMAASEGSPAIQHAWRTLLGTSLLNWPRFHAVAIEMLCPAALDDHRLTTSHKSIRAAAAAAASAPGQLLYTYVHSLTAVSSSSSQTFIASHIKRTSRS